MKQSIKSIIFIVTISLVVFSCNKDSVQVNKNEAVDLTESRILKFQSDVKSSSQVKRTTSQITVDSAVWYVEALCNYLDCRTLPQEEYQNCELLTDSITIDFPTTNGFANYDQALSAYNTVNSFMLELNSKLTCDWKHNFLVDIEYKESQLIGRVSIAYKNVNMSARLNLYPDLNYDWHTGAGACANEMGRCDGTFITKSAATIDTVHI